MQMYVRKHESCNLSIYASLSQRFSDTHGGREWMHLKVLKNAKSNYLIKCYFVTNSSELDQAVAHDSWVAVQISVRNCQVLVGHCSTFCLQLQLDFEVLQHCSRLSRLTDISTLSGQYYYYYYNNLITRTKSSESNQRRGGSLGGKEG